MALKLAREIQHTNGHHKFWRFYIAPGSAAVNYQWGRIGTAGQCRAKNYSSHANALVTANDAAEVKLTEGYHEVAPPVNGLGLADTWEKPALGLVLPDALSVSFDAMAMAGVKAEKAFNALGPAMKRAGLAAKPQKAQRAAKRKEADANQTVRAITLGDDDL